MKNLNSLLFLSFVTLIVIGLNSCNSCKRSQENDTITFEEVIPDSTLFDKLDSQFEQPDTAMALLGKGSTWKTWRKLQKECMKAEWLRNPYYFGVSSTVNLGAIVDKHYDLQRTMDSTSGFTDVDLASIINYGNYTDCGYYQEMTMSLNVFLQSEFDFTQTGEPDLNAELQTAISKSSQTKVKVDNWRINNVREDNLIDILKDAPDTAIYKKGYFKTLKEDKNYILVKVIEIKGFTSYIELSRDMSAGLEAKLKEGVVAPMGNAGIEASFSFKDKRTIEVKSGGNFYVFGQFKKVKKVN
jgi:hypothetical protein